jgi:hypothetical protein
MIEYIQKIQSSFYMYIFAKKKQKCRELLTDYRLCYKNNTVYNQKHCNNLRKQLNDFCCDTNIYK